ncbi:MAG: Gfo/Idh/MocA family oxidoreductase, partial [Clostridiales bacterium]|nr:Gfo/Idh/MocA family oxidoreductase [Clostridiales bacterium]
RDDVDAVSVCTPNELHEEMALAVLKAGKHLYIDKPLAVTGDSALQIAEAARISKGFSKVAFNLRHYPATMRLKELADAGELGEILQFSARYLHSGSVDPDRPIGWKQQRQGGVLLDMGSHALDMVTWLMGYPEKVNCSLRTLYDKRPRRDGTFETELSDDHALMTLQMPNGALGTVEASKIATGALDEMTIEVRGAKGAAIFATMQPNYLRFFDQSRPERPLGGARGFTDIECAQRYPAPGGGFPSVKNAIGWDRAHVDCYFDFLHCISRGRRPESTVEKAARLQKLMDTLVKSAEAGEWARV